MMETVRIHAWGFDYDAFIVDEVPEVGSEFFYDHFTVIDVEDPDVPLEPKDVEDRYFVYHVVTRIPDSKGMNEYFCCLRKPEFFYTLILGDNTMPVAWTYDRDEAIEWLRSLRRERPDAYIAVFRESGGSPVDEIRDV